METKGNRREYAQGTFLEMAPGPFACGYVKGRALCSDGKVRAVRFVHGGVPDTFFSIPASVKVREPRGDYYSLPESVQARRASGNLRVQSRWVSGYVTTETLQGFTTHDTEDDPVVVKFIAYKYGKNHDLLPLWEGKDY